ncbi:hypothetical protein ALC57_09485 [Trachymyrmex cornetzi]|uniref:Uncharacterized protein n=1 Tax=Trachymyrmex cornetzi TaxID=471704 RepID=A0A151J5D1_9HYME|nr:hypothetical protein ALC57_09485 [Trachymyrmex cornetzi]
MFSNKQNIHIEIFEYCIKVNYNTNVFVYYKQIVEKMISDFQKLKCNMNLKLHFLDSHLDTFPENLGDFSEEQGELFHQDIKVMETRYQGRWDVNMMADFCWTLKRESTESWKRKRTSLHRSFENKRTRYS